ncbi:hypothetical protein L1987_15635 [Smallanthus sonchifolius]|uniref:Uncharacterized protein n=1 Tax=Smallanthus sonchifolius TaxID=185202 RepID=A0ACB9J897_9ASTR|nr:hypothetical protein L1987_15635 [Smallanthus sonchifolius]
MGTRQFKVTNGDCFYTEKTSSNDLKPRFGRGKLLTGDENCDLLKKPRTIVDVGCGVAYEDWPIRPL